MYFGDLHLQKTSFYQGKTIIFIKSPFRFNTNSGTHFDSVGDKLPVVFVTFSVSDPNWFPNLVFLSCWIKNIAKWLPKTVVDWHVFLTFSTLFRRWCFWKFLGSLWLPFGSLLVSFWFRLDSFRYPFLIRFELLTVRFLFIVYLTPLPSGCALSALAH